MMLQTPISAELNPEFGVRSCRKKILQYSLTLGLLAGSMSSVSQAGVVALVPDPFVNPETFTSSSEFNAALPGLPSVTTFDNVDAGTIIPNGSQLGNITYSLDSLRDFDLIVADNFSTTSPPNQLGVDDDFANEFLSGEELTFTFGGLIQAFGLFIIGSPEQVFPSDLQLVGGGLSVFNVDPEFILDDGGEVFFLGIVNENGFDSARLNSFGDIADPFFAFNIDDITTFSEVPEPETLLLMVFGLVLLIRHRRRTSTRQVNLNSDLSTQPLFGSKPLLNTQPLFTKLPNTRSYS